MEHEDEAVGSGGCPSDARANKHAVLWDRNECDYEKVIDGLKRDPEKYYASPSSSLKHSLSGAPYDQPPFSSWSKMWRDALNYEMSNWVGDGTTRSCGWPNCEYFVTNTEQKDDVQMSPSLVEEI